MSFANEKLVELVKKQFIYLRALLKKYKRKLGYVVLKTNTVLNKRNTKQGYFIVTHLTTSTKQNCGFAFKCDYKRKWPAMAQAFTKRGM